MRVLRPGRAPRGSPRAPPRMRVASSARSCSSPRSSPSSSASRATRRMSSPARPARRVRACAGSDPRGRSSARAPGLPAVEHLHGVAQVFDAFAPPVHRAARRRPCPGPPATAPATLPVEVGQPGLEQLDAARARQAPARHPAAQGAQLAEHLQARGRARPGCAPRHGRARRRAARRSLTTPRAAGELLRASRQQRRRACPPSPRRRALRARRRPASRRTASSRAKAASPSGSSSSAISARRRFSDLRVSCTATDGEVAPPSLREQLDRVVELLERHAPQPVREQLPRQQRELTARARRATLAQAAVALGLRQRHAHADAGRSRRAWRRRLPRAARQWSHVPPSARPMVDGSPRGEPQADDVSLSVLWSSSGGPHRAYADRPRR